MDLLLSPAPLLDANRFQFAIRRLADSLGYGTDRSIFRGAKDSPVNGTSATMSTGISEPMGGW
jgi:hypothetical protein